MDARHHTPPPQSSRLAAGSLRPHRAGAAGRRRARRLSGRRLSGAARSRHRAGLGLAACRSAPSTRRSSPAIRRSGGWQRLRDLLGAHHRPQDLALHARRRHLPQGPQPRQFVHDHARSASPASSSRTNVNPWFSPAGAADATSYYDNSPLRETLLELVDFDLINSRKVHFAVGAVNVLTGNFALLRQHARK